MLTVLFSNAQVLAPDYQKIKNYKLIENSTEYPRTGANWIVYSDRSDNPVYTDSLKSSDTKAVAGFLQRFEVTDETKSFVKVSSDSIIGWMTKSRLILIPNCMLSSSKVTKKAFIKHNIENFLKSGGKYTYTRPDNSSKSYNIPGLTYGYGFIYKDLGNYCLLGEKSNFDFNRDNNSKDLKVGWVEKKYITEWNNRMVILPNTDQNAVECREKANSPVVVFNNAKYANLYMNTWENGIYDIEDSLSNHEFPMLWWEYNLTDQDLRYDYMYYGWPVIDKNDATGIINTLHTYFFYDQTDDVEAMKSWDNIRRKEMFFFDIIIEHRPINLIRKEHDYKKGEIVDSIFIENKFRLPDLPIACYLLSTLSGEPFSEEPETGETYLNEKQIISMNGYTSLYGKIMDDIPFWKYELFISSEEIDEMIRIFSVLASSCQCVGCEKRELYDNLMRLASEYYQYDENAIRKIENKLDEITLEELFHKILGSDGIFSFSEKHLLEFKIKDVIMSPLFTEDHLIEICEGLKRSVYLLQKNRKENKYKTTPKYYQLYYYIPLDDLPFMD